MDTVGIERAKERNMAGHGTSQGLAAAPMTSSSHDDHESRFGTAGSSNLLRPSGSRFVVTAPPWAKDEPAEPHNEPPTTVLEGPSGPVLPSGASMMTGTGSNGSALHLGRAVASDVTSLSSHDGTVHSPSRWWTFTLPRPPRRWSGVGLSVLGASSGSAGANESQDQPPPSASQTFSSAKLRRASTAKTGDLQRLDEKDGINAGARAGGGGGDGAATGGDTSTGRPRTESDGTADTYNTGSRTTGKNLRLDLPVAQPPFTLAHSNTPGWGTPWDPRTRRNGSMPITGLGDTIPESPKDLTEEDLAFHKWRMRRRNFKDCLLLNIYVPLVVRILNLAFTTATLAVAVRIRQIESKNHIVGIVGSSPTLAVIFGPLTLVPDATLLLVQWI